MSLAIKLNGALCLTSFIAWLPLALVWQKEASNPKIKLPATKEDEATATTALDEDIPVDTEQWEKGNLYRKIPCTFIAAVAAGASTLHAFSIGNSLALSLQAAFWVSDTSPFTHTTTERLILSRSTILPLCASSGRDKDMPPTIAERLECFHS